MQVMQRLASMLLAGVALGYDAGTVNSVLANRPQTPAVRAPVQTGLPAARTAPPDIAWRESPAARGCSSCSSESRLDTR